MTGYVEQTVDKGSAFFRVFVHSKEFHGVDQHGKAINRPTAPRGKAPAFVEFYNVQCVDDSHATVTPMNSGGVVRAPFVLSPEQFGELETYAAQLGASVAPAPQAAP